MGWRRWFNIAYRQTLETRGTRVRASWKNMLDLEAGPVPRAGGHVGFFLERGGMIVTEPRR